MPVTAVQRLLQKCPELLQQDVDGLRNRIQAVSMALGLAYQQVAFMVAKQPQYFLATDPQVVADKAGALAAALQVSVADIAQWATTTPSIFKRQAPTLVSRIQAICSLLDTRTKQAIALAANDPQYITDAAGSLQQRFDALCKVLLLQPVTVRRVVQQQPDVLFMSPRIMMNKAKVLMSIFDKDRKAVGLLIYKAPQLMRCDLTRVRQTYSQLQDLLQKSAGYVFAMMCHNARLLLVPQPKLQYRILHLHACLSRVPAWQQEWHTLRPPHMEECLSRTSATYLRLEYLAVTQQASSVSLVSVLLMSHRQFIAQYQSYTLWLSTREQSDHGVQLQRGKGLCSGTKQQLHKTSQPYRSRQAAAKQHSKQPSVSANGFRFAAVTSGPTAGRAVAFLRNGHSVHGDTETFMHDHADAGLLSTLTHSRSNGVDVLARHHLQQHMHVVSLCNQDPADHAAHSSNASRSNEGSTKSAAASSIACDACDSTLQTPAAAQACDITSALSEVAEDSAVPHMPATAVSIADDGVVERQYGLSSSQHEQQSGPSGLQHQQQHGAHSLQQPQDHGLSGLQHAQQPLLYGWNHMPLQPLKHDAYQHSHDGQHPASMVPAHARLQQQQKHSGRADQHQTCNTRSRMQTDMVVY